jgi:hypothetical protein
VHIMTVIGQRWRNRWKKFAGAVLTIALLSGVAAVGITLFGSEVLAAWKTPGNAEQALASEGAFAGALNFAAPAETVERLETQKTEFAKSQSSRDSVLAKNWKFTQESLADYIIQAYTDGIQLQVVTLGLQMFFPNSPLTAAAFKFTNGFLQIADAFLAALHLPPVPAISPFF